MPKLTLSRLSRSLSTGSTVLAAAAVLAGIGVAMATAPVWQIVAGSALLTAICGLMILRLRKDPLDAPGIYGLATAVLFGVTSLAWLGTPAIPGPGLTREDIVAALLLVSVGAAAFAAASWLVQRPGPHPVLALSGRSPSARALLCGYFIGVAAVVLGIALNAYGYETTAGIGATTAALVQLFSSLGTIATLVILCLALVYFKTNDSRLGRLLVILCVVQIILGFVIGYKGASLDPLLVTLLAYLAIRRRMPWRAIGLAASLTFVVLLPANTAYRAALRDGSGGTVAALQRTLTTPDLYRPERLLSDAYTFVSYRFRLIDSPALILANTPSRYPFADGTRYVQLPLTLGVPRALWPEKPPLDDSTQFSTTYWEIQPSYRTATGITQVGDFYRNFGLVGVLVGMLAWGAVIGGWARMYRRWHSPRLEMIWLYTLLKVVTYVEADIPFLLAYWSKTLPVVLAVAWLLLPGRESPPGYVRLGRLLRRKAGRTTDPVPGRDPAPV